ncbi:glycosyl hydrolase family 28-related protein [Cohnella sp. AR92]|uniref:glycosyl hydrolase family 28-related protein n=1 Tax=Cohnella sp. AR92 TaxID=648716 RepID=UPI00131572AF|nr:glycosyl hydrolase family 28-related protein [Cohnella sp. AR92]
MKAPSIFLVISMLLTGYGGLLPLQKADASTNQFYTGFETKDAQPTWNDTVAYSEGIGGYCCSLTSMESSVRDETAHLGSRALMYSGNDLSSSVSNSYNKIYDVNIPVFADTKLSYYIYPSNLNSTYVAIDLLFTDGTTLRDSGVLDSNGIQLHPAQQGAGGKLEIGKWNQVSARIGEALSGKVIDQILIAYDQGGRTGVFRGFVDDLSISTTQQLFGTDFENANLPTWTNTVDGSSGVSSPQAHPVAGEKARSGDSSLYYAGNDTSTSSSYAVFKLNDVNTFVTADLQLSYWIYPLNGNGAYTSIDLLFTDGTRLRNTGATDQYGNALSPSGQGAGGKLIANQWNEVRSTIGSVANGKTIDRIDLVYDRAASTGTFSGYIDDLQINRLKFSTGLETGDVQPTWLDTVAHSQNIGGYCCSLTGMESAPRENEIYRTGTRALMYSGNDLSATVSNSYNQVFDVSIKVTRDTRLSYWIYPETLNATYVAIDFEFSDGTTLRDSGAVDQWGVRVHPSRQGAGGKLTLNTWNEVYSRIGDYAAGKTIERILIAYDQGGNTGLFHGYVDDIQLVEAAAVPSGNRNSKIVSTTYATEDIIVADYDVTDYGADATGATDSTSSIQRAINDCYVDGGGTVWLPAGTYRISGSIEVKANCTVRGDWRDPDTSGTGYGTVIAAYVPSSTSLTPGLFRIGGSAGVVGLTVYYPNQSASSPVSYPYTFEVPGRAWIGEENYMASTIKNVTMLNSYRGIAASLTPSDHAASDSTAAGSQTHETTSIVNVKGTVLKTGLELYNGAEVGYTQWVKLNNSYWANAGTAYNAPAKSSLDTWTRANGTAFIFGDLEFDQMFQITASDYQTGIKLVTGQRVTPSIELAWANLLNCDIAVDVVQLNPDGLGLSFSRSVLQGSVYSVRNQTTYPIKITDSTVTGSTSGSNITITNPGSPTSASFNALNTRKPTQAVLYDVTQSPYNAAYTSVGTVLPTVDATSAIQSALNAAGTAGGGVVYLPAGWYRVNGHLTVPAGVELRGSSPILHRDSDTRSGGTVLMAYEGKATSAPETATAFITLSGNGAGATGFRVFYPENNPASNIYAYPYTIRGNGSDVYVRNISFTNAYNGIDLKTYANNNHYVSNLVATAFRRGIVVGASTEGWIENTLQNGNAVTRTGYEIPSWLTESRVFAKVITPQTRPSLEWITIDGASNEHLLHNFTYGANVTVKVLSGMTDIYNTGADGMDSTGYAIKVSSGTVKAINLFVSGGTTSSGTISLYNDFKVN